MRNPVMIKGNKYGFTLYLDPKMDFLELLSKIEEKFVQTKRFFSGNSQIALRFEGKKLSLEEQKLVIDKIEEVGDVQVSYIMDEDETNEEHFRQAVELYNRELRKAFEKEKEEYKEELLKQSEALKEEENPAKEGQFYKGTLRSGQSVETENSIVIVGDVNPGANVISGGNIVILGCLKGSATAGFPSDQNNFVVALDMQPMQIRIGDLIARSPDKDARSRKRKKESREPEVKIAYAENERIYIEPISRSLVNDINMHS